MGGVRVAKTDPTIEAVGALDELNAAIGVVLAHKPCPAVANALTPIQHRLFAIGAELAGATTPGVTQADITGLEQQIDELDAAAPPLAAFVLPGGTVAAANLHLARTIARRAERRVLALDPPASPAVRIYLNRLSDVLFAAARAENAASTYPETLWRSEA